MAIDLPEDMGEKLETAAREDYTSRVGIIRRSLAMFFESRKVPQ